MTRHTTPGSRQRPKVCPQCELHVPTQKKQSKCRYCRAIVNDIARLAGADVTIRPDELRSWLRVQVDSSCPCGCSTPVGERAVDHDHESLRLRGLICREANTAIGLLGDDPDRLIAIGRWLKGKGSRGPVLGRRGNRAA